MDLNNTDTAAQVPTPEHLVRTHGLVSVIIPTYNYARYLEFSVGSVLEQSHRQVEVIVVDDGSTDEPELHLAKRFRDPRLRVVHQVRAGISAARNRGISLARGQYVTFLDADDIWPSADQLATQVEFMETDTDVGLLFGDARPFGVDGRSGEPYLQTFGFYPTPSKPVPRRIEISAKLLCTKGFFIPTGALLIRGTCLDKIGMFDTNLRMFEDVDLWLRICRQFPVAFSPDVFLLRREHQANTGATRLQFYEDVHYFFHKNDLASDGLSFRAMSRDFYFELGKHHLEVDERTAARKAFARSLLCGFRPKSLVYFLFALSGRRPYGLANRIWTQLKRASARVRKRTDARSRQNP